MTTIITFDNLLERIQYMPEDSYIDLYNPSVGDFTRIIRVPDYYETLTIVIKEIWSNSNVSAASYITEDENDYTYFASSVAEILEKYGIIIDDNSVEVDEERSTDK